jgi:hypothetical protein
MYKKEVLICYQQLNSVYFHLPLVRNIKKSTIMAMAQLKLGFKSILLELIFGLLALMRSRV